MATDSGLRSRLDLDAYLRRIAYHGDLRPAPGVLEALHLAHATHIPFENLDILLGRPIPLDLGRLQAKLVRGERGGYCFEQNLLFAAVLREVGFAVTPLAARVRYGTRRVLPRTHMLLHVAADGEAWVADVGFGGKGLLLPVPFVADQVAAQFSWAYRLVEERGQWVLQSLQEGGWLDLYAFTLEPQELADYELANYFTSTHPASPFTNTITVQLPTPSARYVLRNREFSVEQGDTVTSRLLADDRELLQVLAATFGLRFPAGTRFSHLGAGVAQERAG
jgi:N-hydroxyarylamine O-acetyltransferase